MGFQKNQAGEGIVSSREASTITNVEEQVFERIGNSNHFKLFGTLVQTLDVAKANDIIEIGFVDPNIRANEGVKAALEEGTIIFSALPEILSNGEPGIPQTLLSSLERVFEFANEENEEIEYYFIEGQGITSDAIVSGEASLEHVRFEAFNIEELPEGQGFIFTDKDSDLRFTARLDETAEMPIGTALQGQFNREVIDLRGNEEVTVTLGLGGVRSVGDFENLVGLYQVDNPDGGIDTDNDGVANLVPGDDGYTEQLLANAVDDFILKGGGSLDPTDADDLSVNLEGNQILVPFLIAQGGNLQEIPASLHELPEGTNLYTPYIAGNGDGADHFRLLGDNTFGIEDLPGGGDQDFNDMIIQLNLNFATSSLE